MRKDILAFIFFLAVSLAFFYPIFFGKVPFPGDLLVGEYAPYNSYSFMGYAPGGYPNKGQNFDVLRLLYPWKEFSMESFASGSIPLWNPYSFSGTPHLASMQAGTFYPLNSIFLIPSFVIAWTLYILVQPILAGFFLYLFLGEFGLQKKSRLFGGVVFAFSSYLVVWMEYGNLVHTILWLPLLLFFGIRFLKKPNTLLGLGFAFVVASSILAGYIQTTFYVFAFTLFFLCFYAYPRFKSNRTIGRNILFLAPFGMLGILLTAAQMLPTVELLGYSARAPYEKEAFLNLLIPLQHLVTILVPDFFGNPATRNYWLSGTYIERVTYIGLLPLLFALLAVISRKTRLVWFFTGVLVVTLSLTFDTFFSRAVYSLQLPFISTAVPTRVMFIAQFAASVLAAIGLDEFLKKEKKKQFKFVIIGMGIVFVGMWFFVFFARLFFPLSPWLGELAITKRNLLLPTALFVTSVAVVLLSTKFKKWQPFTFPFILVITLFDTFYFFHKITPFAPQEAVYPHTAVIKKLRESQGINRSWGYGSGYIESNLHTHEKLFSPDGYDALHSKRYGELITASKEGKISMSPPRSEAVLQSGFGGSELRQNRFRQAILNLLGVKYILHKITPAETLAPDLQTFPKETYKLVWQTDAWQIYENTKAYPRLFLSRDYVVETDSQKIADAIFASNEKNQKIIVLEEDPNIQKKEIVRNESVKLVSYKPSEIKLTAQIDEEALLFLSDVFYPGWKVSISGKDAKIYRANYAFRAVLVPAGKHNVVFTYEPESFKTGALISLGSFALLSLLGLLAIVRKRKK